MSNFPQIENPYGKIIASKRIAIGDAEVELAVLKHQLSELAVRNTQAQALIGKACIDFIDFPISKLDWQVAMLEATKRVDATQKYDDRKPAKSKEIGLPSWLHDNDIRTEAEKIASSSFGNDGDTMQLYLSVLKGFEQDHKKMVESAKFRIRRKLFSMGMVEKLGTMDIIFKAPKELREHVLFEELSNTGLNELRKTSAQSELMEITDKLGLMTMKTLADGEDRRFNEVMETAFRPLYSRRQEHLNTLLASIAPKHAA